MTHVSLPILSLALIAAVSATRAPTQSTATPGSQARLARADTLQQAASPRIRWTGHMSNHQPLRRTVEIRSYNLKPGTRDRFHQLAVEAARLLARVNIDVVAHGPSPHDSTTYFLIRAFDDLEDRQRREDAFYGSAAWRDGPRDQVLALIESYTTIVLDLDATTVESLRALGRVTGR